MFVTAAFGAAALLAGCGGVARPARTATTVAPSATAATAARAIAATPPPRATQTAPPADARCPDPNLTPLPASPSPASQPTASGTGPAGTPAPTPTPIRIQHAQEVPPPAAAGTPPPSPRTDAALERLIRDRLGSDAPHYAVVVEDLRDGRRAAVDPDRVFYAASLFKLEVMYEVFHQHAAGLLDFDEEYVASDYYSGFDLGPHLIAPCERASVRRLLGAMMSVSDNVAAVMLQDRAGAGNINNAMAALGLTQTRLTEDGSLPATAGDLARLVEAIALGEAGAAATSDMLDLMVTEELGDRIPAKLPAGTRVAHKTGNFDGATHDAGIVYGKKGTYVMVLMSDIGFEANAGSVEADIAKIAFDYFEGP